MVHRTSTHTRGDSDRETIPEIKDGVRIIPLGGVEEVGRNMTVVETDDDIVIVDAGFQFVSEEAPGVDYILPNTRYLEERKDKIRALLITHGHLDHIGGIPFIIDRIGNPPIYTGELTSIMIKKRAEEFPLNVGDSFFIEERGPPDGAVRYEEPPGGIRTILANHIERVHRILLRLRHFLSLLIQNVLVDQSILVSWFVKEKCADGMERIEPTPSLVNSF